MGTPVPLSQKGGGAHPLPQNKKNVGPCLLWPNGWMHQDATWYGSKRRSRRRCVRWGRSSPYKGSTQPPVFGSCLLWPNGCMYEDATWYGSRPQPRPYCIRRGVPALRERGTAAPPVFSPHVYCGHGRPSQLLLSYFYFIRFRQGCEVL